MEKIRFQICEKELTLYPAQGENRPLIVFNTVMGDGEELAQAMRAMERHKISESQAKDVMIKTDKKRASYYNYYSSKRWGDSKSYDLCMNSSKIGYDGVVKMIQDFVEIKKGYKK